MYPRRSRFSPEIRPGNARQQLGMTIWACVFLTSIVVMFAAFVLSGNFGVRELVCVMIGSGAAVVFGICCFMALPTLVRAMHDALQGPGDSRPAIGTFIMIAAAALIGTTMVVMGGGAFTEGYEDARTGPQTKAVTSCEKYFTVTERGRRGSTYYRNYFTLHFDDGTSRRFEVTTDAEDELAQPTSPYYAVYQACVIQPSATSIVIEVYPRSGIIKAIREA